ncbi:hypothetical protein [Amycolatopsis sp. H20-H5]|uniref:hypothetical protein n=1 Tax=Amycolatopsis sp. H20-H5 TaxID=3046309 RepID=UPI002DB7102A|nr:hypothetical protein [Amycolatopsis sp. H20-H5]MEC3979324.1 hypothetical protein [Amycolatopsis sp. H20-H5]
MAESTTAKVIGWTLVTAVGIWAAFALAHGDDSPPLPSRAEAESTIVAKVGEETLTGVVANCAEPDDQGYDCLLRDQKGRHGYSGTFFMKQNKDDEGGYRRFLATTRWDFPLDSDGILAQRALTHDRTGTVATCPEPAPGQTVTCAVTGLLRTATVNRIDALRYRLVLTFTVPPPK